MSDINPGVALAVPREQAQSIVDHLITALKSDTDTILLYSHPLVIEDPQTMKDLPIPGVMVFDSVYIVALDIAYEDFRTQAIESADGAIKADHGPNPKGG